MEKQELKIYIIGGVIILLAVVFFIFYQNPTRQGLRACLRLVDERGYSVNIIDNVRNPKNPDERRIDCYEKFAK